MVAAIAAVLALLVWFFWPRGPVGPAYLTAVVETQDVSLTAQGTGTVVDAQLDSVAADGSWVVAARHGVSTGAQVQGDAVTVVKFNVAVGDSVSAGQAVGVYRDGYEDTYDITAPQSGVIRSVAVAAGAAGGGEAFTIGVGTVEVTAAISEYDIANVAAQQPVRLAFDGLGATGEGVVTAILPVAADDAQGGTSGVTEYPVVASITELPEGLRLGMKVQMTIEVQSAEGVLAVPVQALDESDGGAYTVTSVAKDGRPQVVAVEVGLIGDSYAEITSGLAEGDAVVIGTPGEGGTTGGFPGAPGAGGAGGPIQGIGSR